MLFGKSPVIVLRDGPEVLKAVREVLATAAPGEQAGLERAVDIIEAQCARTEDDVLGQWVRGILADAGLDARSDHAESVAALRKAVPDLTLVVANRLVTNAVSQ
ncbi:hypothetical protein ACFVYD_22695 [Streptomyces sp. NPDC058301]|uniref:hypothetical protein n=1 Tax=Streptomyces sp. NPDC058301 TaxID=3346436 RepID=UPI0036DFD577